jgi:DNA-binding NtrC family response regulator
LKVVPIEVPGLRDRAADIPRLVAFFARRICEKNNLREKPIDADVMRELQSYHWPGNVRELQNVIERMLIMSAEGQPVAFSEYAIYWIRNPQFRTRCGLRPVP